MQKTLWTDNIWYEGDKAWFVSGELNALFELDENEHDCKCVGKIPNTDFSERRQNSNCIKAGENIFCFPYGGKEIWVYDLRLKEFYQIEIDNPLGISLQIYDFWLQSDTIYAVSMGLKQVVEIDIVKKEIVKYYKIVEDENERLSFGEKVGESIFCCSVTKNRIYELNVSTGNVTYHEFPKINTNISRICFDGSKFWLSGKNKAIYIWDKKENVITELNDFPQKFGVYDFLNKRENVLDCTINEYEDATFFKMVSSEKYVWLIPFRTNYVLYVDKETYEVKYLDITEEVENRNTLQAVDRALNHKFLVLYYRNKKMIGLYSLKNNNILEIDTESVMWKYKEFDAKKAIAKLFLECSKLQEVLTENTFCDLECLVEILKSN